MFVCMGVEAEQQIHDDTSPEVLDCLSEQVSLRKAIIQ